ncbi:MAG TPA: winged helix-turn-helix domain-containing protein [Methanotrichaceae archaeon]|nr:winged helix-turn-helix domain-containing protein [Methanotrichaceae archaeon]
MKITELWESGEHNAAEIARQIGYPRATTHENIKRLIKAGTLQESRGAGEPEGEGQPDQKELAEEYDIYGDLHGDIPGENRQPEE